MSFLFLVTFSNIATVFAEHLFSVKSDAFIDGERIPTRYTCFGDNVSPPLSWSHAPHNTESYAIIVIDTDAPRGPWTHWIVYNIPASVTRFDAGQQLTGAMRVGLSSWPLKRFYLGPCPSDVGRDHRYFFHIFALNSTLPSSDAYDTRQILATMQDRTVAEALIVGKFGRPIVKTGDGHHSHHVHGDQIMQAAASQMAAASAAAELYASKHAAAAAPPAAAAETAEQSTSILFAAYDSSAHAKARPTDDDDTYRSQQSSTATKFNKKHHHTNNDIENDNDDSVNINYGGETARRKGATKNNDNNANANADDATRTTRLLETSDDDSVVDDRNSLNTIRDSSDNDDTFASSTAIGLGKLRIFRDNVDSASREYCSSDDAVPRVNGITRVHLIISGKVQNVYYGQYATLTAKDLGVVGYVKSLPDETIEIIAEGSYEQLCQFLRWCHIGSPRSSVSDVRVDWQVPLGHLTTFAKFD